MIDEKLDEEKNKLTHDRYIYYFYKDTAYVKTPENRDYIWLPKTFEGYSNKKRNDKLYV